MKIYLNAFSVTDICPAFDLALFEQNLPEVDEFKLFGRDRVLSAGLRGNYLVGLLSSSTGQNKDLLLTRDRNGRLVFRISDTSAQGDRQAFNFFVINVTNGMGLLSRYFGAGSVSSFGHLLRNRYQLKRREYRDQYLLGLAESGEDYDEEAEKQQFAVGKFVITPVYRTGTFEQQLESLRAITELTYDEPTVGEPRYQTVRDQLKLDRRQLKFEVVPATGTQPWRNAARGRIVDFIRAHILRRDVNKATVHGKDLEGREMPPVTLSPEIDSFGDYPYNDVVVEENMPAEDIASSPFIGQMLGIARANAGVFETPIR